MCRSRFQRGQPGRQNRPAALRCSGENPHQECNVKTYLPDIDISDLVHALASHDWTVVEEKIHSQQYERLGLDRAFAIASDLLMRHQSLTGDRKSVVKGKSVSVSVDLGGRR